MKSTERWRGGPCVLRGLREYEQSHETRTANGKTQGKGAASLWRLFHQFVRAAKKKGLVGEEVNGLVLLVVCISRLLSRPLHVFVKGKSSAGKNFLARLVLSFMPKRAVTEVTSVSDQAWNYLNKDFRHTVIYLQEVTSRPGTWNRSGC